jgi:LuxR family transcriptional regulator, maltose regulon positive regulatory protein
MSAFPLLFTKLNLPPRRPSLVTRPRLLDLLDLGLLPGTRLTLLAAPAGFGKTSLVIDWQSRLAERGIRAAWFSLDEADNELARFLRYLVAAIRKLLPELGESLLSLLDLPQRPPVENLMVALINELEAVQSDFVLVLDDYQVIQDQAVLQSVGYLVEHGPEHCHLVLTTRSEPALPLARLRARGQVNEIRAADLRFTPQEALQFVRGFPRLEMNDQQAALLEQHTEGWVAGLQMAAIALQAFAARHNLPGERDEFLASFSGTHQYVFDYLAQEVLNQQGAEVVDFLHQTALFERICPALCDTLTGREDSRQILRMLDQSNLFIQPMDEQRQWYRYHRLFAGFLRAGLDTSRQTGLYRRAAAWFEANGLLEEALSYTIKAGDWTSAVRLIKQELPRLFQAGDFVTLQAWFDGLPEAVVGGDLDLVIYQGWVSLLKRGMGRAAVMAELAVGLTAGATDESRGLLLGLQAFLAFAAEGNHEQAERLGQEAVRLIDPSDRVFRTMLLSLLGQIQRQYGSVVAAIHTFEEAVRAAERAPAAGYSKINTGLAIMQGNLALSYYFHGERRRADAFCRETIRRYINAKGQAEAAALFIYMPWVEFSFAGNALVEARRYVETGFALCQKMGTTPIVVGGSNLWAALHFLEGDTGRALADVRANQAEAIRMGLPWIADAAATLEAWFELKLGNLAFVEAWERQTHLPLTAADLTHIDEQLLQARLFLARKQFAESLTLLDAIRQRAEQDERYILLLEAEVLLGLACRGAGRLADALDWIERAVRRAAPEGCLRAFLNEDAAGLVAELGTRLKEKVDGGVSQFIQQLLDAYRAEGVQVPAAQVQPEAKPAGLVEPITPRELEVLQLMAQGLSNAEIARRLYLTVNTLKAHTNSIYGKLDVHSRLQAVNRGRELGLL